MKEQQLGVVTSLAIHSGLLVLLLSMPITNTIPYMKTFYISFEQQESSPSAVKNETKAVVRPRVEKVQRISEPEATEAQHLQDEVIVNEKPVMLASSSTEITGEGKNENQSSVKTGISNLAKAESRGSIEPKFGDTDAPAFIHRELPVYPLLARRLGKEGKVVLKLVIDKYGTLQHIEVMEQSGFGFAEAAIEALKKSTFTPAHRNGENVASRAILAVRFNLKRETSGE